MKLITTTMIAAGLLMAGLMCTSPLPAAAMDDDNGVMMKHDTMKSDKMMHSDKSKHGDSMMRFFEIEKRGDAKDA